MRCDVTVLILALHVFTITSPADTRLPSHDESAAAYSKQPDDVSNLQSIRRIVFIGDSITQTGEYVVDIECCLLSQGYNIEILNLGLSSETATNLTEAENAGHIKAHGFGRPAISERLRRVLTMAQPNMLAACYGMNDGGSLPSDQTGLERFTTAITHLRETALEAGVLHVILCTPPVHDAKETTANIHDQNLTQYSEWMLGQREEGWAVVDMHGPMRAALDKERAKNPRFSFAQDSVHPNREGHWNMARAFMEQYFGRDLGDISSSELLFENNGAHIRRLVQQRMRLLSDAWMTKIGHTRPGVAGGPNASGALSVDEANAKASEITRQIARYLE